jgi:hypothetical protein
LSGIPPLSNMMGNADDYDTRQPSHRKKLTGMTQSAHSNGLVLALWFPDREEIIGVRPVCPQIYPDLGSLRKAGGARGAHSSKTTTSGAADFVVVHKKDAGMCGQLPRREW